MTGGPTSREGALALLIAATTPDCAERTARLFHGHPDPRYPVRVAHALAHLFVGSIDREDWPEMCDDLRAELLDLARDGSP